MNSTRISEEKLKTKLIKNKKKTVVSADDMMRNKVRSFTRETQGEEKTITLIAQGFQSTYKQKGVFPRSLIYLWKDHDLNACAYECYVLTR